MQDKSNTVRSLAFLALYFIVSNAVVFLLPFDIFSVESVEPISQVEYQQSTVKSPKNLLSSQWESIQLPDFWHFNKNSSNNQSSESIWYQTQINFSGTNDSIWAVYIPSVTHNAVVYINGIWVGHSGELEADNSRYHNTPQLFKFSSNLLKQGFNLVSIKVSSTHVSQGLLGKFYVAPSSALQASFDFKHFVRVDFIQWLTIFMFVYVAVTILFLIKRPEDSVYGYFAAMMFFWAVHNLNLFVNNIPISAQLWEALNISTLGWTVVMMIMFNHRYIGEINKKIEATIVIMSLLGLSIFFIPDVGNVLAFGYVVWDSVLIIIGIYAQYYLLHAYIHQQNKDAYLLTLVGIPLLVLGLHDILVVNHFIDVQEGLIIQFSIIPTILIFSWFLIRRFFASISQAEQLAETLEQRVQQKQLALEEQYQQLNEFEKQTVLSQERERIMRDMHDGIGGQLISIVTVLSDKKEDVFLNIKEKIQHSISDLRFVIDSLDPLLNDISTLLGGMRLRLSEQLSDANMTLEWQTTELPEMKALSPTHSLHFMRIVQEAVTNSIKHSNAKTVTIASGVLYDSENTEKKTHVFIDVSDNGLGLKERKADELQGRGITNMAYRAKQLEGILTILPVNSGTTVRLTLPLTVE